MVVVELERRRNWRGRVKFFGRLLSLHLVFATHIGQPDRDRDREAHK